MAIIQKQNNDPLSPRALLKVPAWLVPSFRVVYAAEKGHRHDLLFKLHGGLGDIICAEPAVRFGLENFAQESRTNVSLATLYPGLFQHLDFKKVFSLENQTELNVWDYLVFENVDTGNELAAEFVCHALMHGIDYGSLYMWRMILPREYREIKLVPNAQEREHAKTVGTPDLDVVIHPGKTWKSRTLPKKWWDSVIKAVSDLGARPVVIGGVIDQGRASTIDVDLPEGALDLRGKQSIMETVALLQNSRVILTNDSSPVHMATTGDAWIGFLSTVKHPDHMYTWRKGQWAWRMQDFAKGRVWDSLNVCPNKDVPVTVDNVDTVELLSWLPSAHEFAEWGVSKLEEK